MNKKKKKKVFTSDSVQGRRCQEGLLLDIDRSVRGEDKDAGSGASGARRAGELRRDRRGARPPQRYVDFRAMMVSSPR